MSEYHIDETHKIITTDRVVMKQVVIAITAVIIILSILLAGCPMYKVWKSKKDGEAQLAEANYNRQIKVAEAHATMEAASLLAGADTIRAHGTARANQIIGASISPEYINWLWVMNMEKQDKSVIYVPSSNLGLPNQLPITEAGRLQYTPELSSEQK